MKGEVKQECVNKNKMRYCFIIYMCFNDIYAKSLTQISLDSQRIATRPQSNCFDLPVN